MAANTKDQWALAIETSCRIGSVALAVGEQLVAEEVFTADRHHAIELIPAIDRMLRSNGIGADNVQWVFLSAGPGSFTALRIGFTFARAFSQVGGAKLVPVPTCEVIAENLRGLLADQASQLDVATILDAKRKQVYAAAFRWSNARLEKVIAEQVIFPGDLVNRLRRPLWVIGEGIDYHRQALMGEGITIVDSEFWRPSASKVLALGWRRARSDGVVAYEKLVPTYIRLPEAEERWQAGLLNRPR